VHVQRPGNLDVRPTLGDELRDAALAGSE